jgi:hypothetical protein
MTSEVVARSKTPFTRHKYEQEIHELFRNRTRVGKTKKKRFEHGAYKIYNYKHRNTYIKYCKRVGQSSSFTYITSIFILNTFSFRSLVC